MKINPRSTEDAIRVLVTLPAAFAIGAAVFGVAGNMFSGRGTAVGMAFNAFSGLIHTTGTLLLLVLSVIFAFRLVRTLAGKYPTKVIVAISLIWFVVAVICLILLGVIAREAGLRAALISLLFAISVALFALAGLTILYFLVINALAIRESHFDRYGVLGVLAPARLSTDVRIQTLLLFIIACGAWFMIARTFRGILWLIYQI